jgi:hypothetical protein
MAALPEPVAEAGLPVPAGAAGLPAGGPPRLQLGGRQKAATLLVSLGPEQAAEVLQHLPNEEIEALSLEMA